MKYNGNELEEMTPENWDGKSREMLVWSDYSEPCLALVCGFTLKGHPIADTGNYKKENAHKHYVVFQYCADIPKEEKKPRRMTNRELSDLLSTGKAEKCYPYNVNGRDVTKVYRTHSYYRNREDSPCAKSILIRYEGTNEWVKPLIEE